MKKDHLSAAELRIVQLIEVLHFGVIEHLLIREGSPSFDQEPGVVQSIKLDSGEEEMPSQNTPNQPLKKEFENLFKQLHLLRDGHVDIQVRHGLPIRLVVAWPQTNGVRVLEAGK